LGEAARVELDWETSGVELLWAAGHFPQIVSILKYLAADGEAEGPTSAVMLYSWLPSRMIEFERANIRMRFKDKYHIDGTDVFDLMGPNFMAMDSFAPDWSEQPHVDEALLREALALDSGAREAERYARDQSQFRYDGVGPSLDTTLDLESRCESEAFRSRVLQAWQRYIARELEVSGSELALRVVASAAVVRIEMHVVDAMIRSAEMLGDVMYPSYAVPKLWRMLSGWIYEIDEIAAKKWMEALPDTFVNRQDVRARDESEKRQLFAPDPPGCA
jgi:hypothetical protein